MLPTFTERGDLPRGIYNATLDEIGLENHQHHVKLLLHVCNVFMRLLLQPGI